MMKKLILITLTLSLILTGCAANKDKEKKPEVQAEVVPVKVSAVKMEKLTENIDLSGVLTAKNEVIVTAKTGGEITKITKEVGNSVSKGELLIQLDTVAYKYQRSKALLGIETAEANLRNLKNQYDRLKALYESGSVPKADLEQLELQVSLGEIAVKNAKFDLDSINLNIGYTSIKSPISGVVAERKVSNGENIGNGDYLFRIVDTKILYVETGVSETLISKIKVGDTVEFASQGMPFKGVVESISPVMSKESKTYPVKIAVSNENQSLKVGMTVTATIKLGELREALAVNKSSVIISGDKKYVMRVEGNKCIKQEIEIGGSNANAYEVVKGIKVGDQIVVSNPSLLKGNEQIKIIQ